jgi:hypothetical protein
MHRIYFDTNEGTHRHGYYLWLSESKNDLKVMGNDAKEGVKVVLYMPNELELEACLTYDNERDCWLGMPCETAVKYL